MIKRFLILVVIIVLFAGCSSVGQFFGEPDIKLKGIEVESLDLDGITFRCDYVVSNPYPVGIKINQVAADVIYENDIFVSVMTGDGLKLAAAADSRNSMLFKLPYESIIDAAGDARGRESLPFALDGELRLNLSGVPGLSRQSVKIPFYKEFDVPVFRPEFRIAGGRVVLPTVKEVAKALVTGGMNILKAGIVAGQLILGEPLDDQVFEGVDLDVTILFDLEVNNRGGAPWAFELQKCSVDTGVGTLLDMQVRGGSAVIDGEGGRLQMAAVVNTLEWGAFVLGLAAGGLADSALVLESSVSFPGLPYAPVLPFNIEQVISPVSFKFGSK